MEITYNILDGPTLNGLKHSLCDGCGQKRLAVSFELDKPIKEGQKTLELVVNSLARESGNTWNWLLKGYAIGEGEWQGYYSTKTGKGWLRKVT